MNLHLPPKGVHDYNFSYSRSNRKMRWRLDGQEWLTTKEVCFPKRPPKLLKADTETGNWTIRCELVLQGSTAYVYGPPKDVVTNENEPMIEGEDD